MRAALLVLATLAVALSAEITAARKHTITLEIHSTPEGAAVAVDNVPRAVGSAPLALKYEITGDCGETQALRVRWASGVEASLPALRLCAKTGKRQTYTFERPTDLPGLDLDLQVAYQQAMLAQMAAIRRAAEDPPPPALAPWTPLPKTSAICVTRTVANGVTYVSCQ